MRLIDADALLKRYDETHEGEPGNARKLIENAPTVDGWISVKDRLPELRQTDDLDIDGSRMNFKLSDFVLVYTDGKIDIGQLEDDGEGPMWLINLWQKVEISHWMPLPEPPKEGEVG